MKIKLFLKKNIKIVVAFILGLIISGSSVYATTIASSSVSYNAPTESGLSNNVQGALDELYTRASKWLNPNDMGKPQYYASIGYYRGWCSSSDTNCNSYAVFPRTSTEPPSGRTVYATQFEEGQYGVCIVRNGTEHCFRGRNFIAETKHIQGVFSDISCYVYPYSVTCYDDVFNCRVVYDGRVSCSNTTSGEGCEINQNGWIQCY